MKLWKLGALALALSAVPVSAATDDFTADGNITVESVTFGETTADLLVLSGSTAESWEYDSGALTVTNPGTFQVGSSDASVKTIRLTQGATTVACAVNTTPGTSYVTAPTTAGTYTISPSALTDCQDQCTAVANAATLNAYPTCGAATCESRYVISGSGATAICIASPTVGSTAARRAQLVVPTSPASPAAPAALAPAVAAGPAPRVYFTGPLALGAAGAPVRLLQELLNRDPATQVAVAGPGAPGQETELFGPLTREALGKFQLKHGLIASADDPAFGYLGPATRAKLAELYDSVPAPAGAPSAPGAPAAPATHAALLQQYVSLLQQYQQLLQAQTNR